MKGCIHIYCGDGKGKTTAALGLSLRALGNGFHVLFVQFMKGQKTGELAMLGHMENISVLRAKVSKKFSWQMDDLEKAEAKAENNKTFQEAISWIERLVAENKDDKTMLVFDEMIGTLSAGLLDEQAVYQFLTDRTAKTEVVMTGRNPSDALIALADYVTEMKKMKHPYDLGKKERVGIER